MAVYISRWVSLAQALATLMATGKSRQDSQFEICLALADRRLDVRVTTVAPNSDDVQDTFEGGLVGVPGHLKLDDLDWERSRPKRGWDLAPTYEWRQDPRQIVLLELDIKVMAELWGIGFRVPEKADESILRPTTLDIPPPQSGTIRLAKPNTPGAGGVKFASATNAMMQAVRENRVDFETLQTMKQKELSKLYPGAERNTLVKAREAALRGLTAAGNSGSISTHRQQSSDKTPTNDK